MNSSLNMIPGFDVAGIAKPESQPNSIRNSSQTQSNFASLFNSEFASKGEAHRHCDKDRCDNSFETGRRDDISDKHLRDIKYNRIKFNDKQEYAEEAYMGIDKTGVKSTYNEGLSTDITCAEQNYENKLDEAPQSTNNGTDNQANESGKEENDPQLKDQANSNEKGGVNEAQINQAIKENTVDDNSEEGKQEKKVLSENGLKAARITANADNVKPDNGDVTSIEEDAAEELVMKNITSGDSEEEGDIDVKKEIDGKAEQGKDIFSNLKGANTYSEQLEADLSNEDESTKIVSNKVMSEFAGNFSQERGSHGNSSNTSGSQSSRGEANAMDVNNIMNSASTASESGKSVGNLMSSNTARTGNFNELMNNIVYVVKSNNKMGVTIYHEQFGKLNIKLSMDQGMVSIHVNASDKSVREMLENNIQNIVEMLKDEGVTVGGFSVALKEQKDSNERAYIANGNNVTEDENDNDKANARGGIGLVSVFA